MTPVPVRTTRSLALASAALLGAAPLLAQQPWDIALRDGLLSIRANGAPMIDLAAALTAETGVSFVVTGDAGSPVTTEIVDEPFAQAVAKLSPNHLLVKEDESAGGAVVEVVLMLDDASSGGAGGGDGFLPSGAPADEIVGGEEELPPLEDAGFDDTLQPEDPMASDGGFSASPEGQPLLDDGSDPADAVPVEQ